MRLADIVVPDSPAARGALEVATAYCPPALLNHSVRAYLWAAAYGAMNDIAFDAELLYVASMMHDIGLVAEFDSHTVPFEEAGGHVAWVFAAGAGWPVERRVRASEIVVRHMWDKVDPEQDPEGHLLELSTALDISGRRPEDFPAELRAEVLERYPRLGLGPYFTMCILEQGARKPDSQAGRLARSGIAELMANNPLEG
ncbi:HD domain-containing protein [Streptosporangium sp. DT93]|uniref:HD domain-containing protein n=1 Tax=Streptosporangium sp. DT93 TaxID=3393428 RepID=UPI003CF24CDC